MGGDAMDELRPAATAASAAADVAVNYPLWLCGKRLAGRLPLHVNQQNHPPNVPGGGVPQNMTTIATILKREGYSTVHAGKWHGGMSHAGQLPIHRGFDTSLAMLSGSADHYTNLREEYVDLWLDDAPAYDLNGTYSLYRYTEFALRAIDAHDPRTPLFLYMAFQDVHGPTEAPSQYAEDAFITLMTCMGRPRRLSSTSSCTTRPSSP